MKRVKSFVETVDIVRWLKFRNTMRVMTSFLDTISKLSTGLSCLVLLILLLREVYFKEFVTIEIITSSIYILYTLSTLVALVILTVSERFDILKIFSSVIKMLASLFIVGVTMSIIKSLEECSILVLAFAAVWCLANLSRRIIEIFDALIQRSLYDFSRVLDDLSILTENDILNLDRTDKVIKIVRQTREAKIENQDLSTEEISYHLSLIVKDYRGKSYDLNRLVYSHAYKEYVLID